MPNLLSNSLTLQKYSNLDVLEKKASVSTLVKSLSSITDRNLITESINEGIILLNPKWQEVFSARQLCHVVLVFLDISSFSTITKGWDSQLIGKYLDKYYDIVLPMVYKHDGVVEKIMGDGIIAIFGEPFVTGTTMDYLRRAERFSRESILTLEQNDISTKCAIHDGQIMYYSTIPEEYLDYTIVGEVVTELFRLESISTEGRINYFKDSGYDKLAIADLEKDEGRQQQKIYYTVNNDDTPVILQGIGGKVVKTITPQ